MDEKERARRARYRAANPDKVREWNRRYQQSPRGQAVNRASSLRWLAKNPDRARAADRRKAHGPDIDADFAAMWEAQAGQCYLCGRALAPGQETHIDHDHQCCPQGKSCSLCRRGLACGRCNLLLGLVSDDPDLLRKIADNFAPVLVATRTRIAGS